VNLWPKAKPDTEKSLEEVAVEQNKVPEMKAETRTKVKTSSRRPPNRSVRFPKLNHPVSSTSGQKNASRIITPVTVLAPHWCPLDLTPS
jgi:hypothetical protein